MSSSPATQAAREADNAAAPKTVSADISQLSVNAILRILRLAARHRLSMTLGIVCAVLAANFQLLIPQYLGAAVDHAQALLADSTAGREAAKSSRAALRSSSASSQRPRQSSTSPYSARQKASM